jgi:hypothetical protein
MIVLKIPRQISYKLSGSGIWVDYDLSNLTFKILTDYAEYALLPRDVGLRELGAAPSDIIYQAKSGEYLIRNKFDGRLISYTREQFQKLYPTKI